MAANFVAKNKDFFDYLFYQTMLSSSKDYYNWLKKVFMKLDQKLHASHSSSSPGAYLIECNCRENCKCPNGPAMGPYHAQTTFWLGTHTKLGQRCVRVCVAGQYCGRVQSKTIFFSFPWKDIVAVSVAGDTNGRVRTWQEDIAAVTVVGQFGGRVRCRPRLD